MGDGVGIFFAGILGVSAGMALLYFSIKLTGTAVSALESKQKSKETAGQGGDK